VLSSALVIASSRIRFNLFWLKLKGQPPIYLVEDLMTNVTKDAGVRSGEASRGKYLSFTLERKHMGFGC